MDLPTANTPEAESIDEGYQRRAAKRTEEEAAEERAIVASRRGHLDDGPVGSCRPQRLAKQLATMPLFRSQGASNHTPIIVPV
jgi:hypothetical protein